MKKEYLLLVCGGLLFFSQIIDALGGRLLPAINNPFSFLSSTHLSTYPLMAVSVAIKTLAITASLVLTARYIKGKHFAKAIIFLLVGGLGILYALQQFATSAFLLPVQWVLSFAYGGVFLLIAAFGSVLAGLFMGVYEHFTEEPKDVVWEKEEKKD